MDILYIYIYIYTLAELPPLPKSLKTFVVRVVERFLMEVQYFFHKAIVRELCLRRTNARKSFMPCVNLPEF